MFFSLLRSRRFLTILALVATGVVVGNLIGGQGGQQWRAQVTGGGTCGNNTVETGEECEQDIDCPGSMKCTNCLCRDKTQCWFNDPWPSPYCNKEPAPNCGVGKQCENCICHTCGGCVLERSAYTLVTGMQSYNPNAQVAVKAAQLSDTSVAVLTRKQEYSYLNASLELRRFDISGKHVLNTQPMAWDIVNALSTISVSGDIEPEFDIAPLDATHVVMGLNVHIPYEGTTPEHWRCFALVGDLGTSPGLGTPVEFVMGEGQSCTSFKTIVALSSTKFVGVVGGKFVVGDINLSARTVTFGSAIAPQGGNTINDMIALDGTRVVAAVSTNTCSDNCSPSFVVGTVSGTSIQWGTPVVVQTPTGRAPEFLSANVNKVLFFDGTSDRTDRTLKLATIQGTAITVGNPAFGLPTPPSGIQLLSAVAFSPEQVLLNTSQYGEGNVTYSCSGTSPCKAIEQMPYRDPNQNDESVIPQGESTVGIALTEQKFVFFPILRYYPPDRQAWNEHYLQIGAITCPACGAACGNGRVDAGEQCGEPGLNFCPENTACQHCTCAVKKWSICGDGNVSYPEQCDWGNAQFVLGAENYNPGGTLTNPVAIAAADFDGDGQKDFVVADRASSNIPDSSALVWSNKGTYFGAVGGWSLLEHPRELVVRDFDRDGKQDIVFTTYERPYLIYAKGNGDGMKKGTASRLFGGVLSSEYHANRDLVAADFNQDAYPDIAFSYGMNKTAVALGSANGFANPVVVSDQGLQHLGTAVGDFNRDAKPDLVLLRNVGAGTVVSVFRGNGNGTFQSAQDYSIEPTNPNTGPLVVADINGDNYDDIVAEPAFSKRLSILTNNRNGTFTIQTSANGVLNSPTFCVADYNRDGRKDLIAGEYELNLLSVYFGKSDGTFSTIPDRMMQEQFVMTDFLCDDLDGDGELDIVMAHGAPQGPIDQSYAGGHDEYNSNHSGLVSLCLSGQGGCELQNPCTTGTCNAVSCMCDVTTPSSSSSSVVVAQSSSSVGPAPSSSSSSSSSKSSSSSSSSSSTHVDVPSSSSTSSSSSSSSYSSSSVSLPPAICANGEMEPGEECEIGYSCLSGYTCTASCACGVITETSSSSSITSASSSSTTSASSSLAATPERCGNGLLEGSEVCEAGHSCGAGRYCSNCQCYTPAYCGDLIVNAANDEECEADDDCPGDQFCTLNCLCHEDTGGNCGNGNLEAREQCERNHPCGDGAQCQSCVCVDVARCGNSSLERGEQCEVNDACPTGSSCVDCLCEQSVGCGNGVLSPGEQCEQDSHCAAGQYCNLLSCRCQGTSTLSCGNGVLDEQEQCDLGQPCQNIEEICDLANCSCLLDAVTTLCGNAQVDSGEDCDIGTPCAEDEICNFSGCHCIPWEQRCGDAELSGDEECEIGSPCADPSEACDLSQCVCATPSPDQVCGDGGIEVGEECEVGMACPFGWSCDFPRCRCQNKPVCGDAVQNPGEQCEINVACSSNDQTCDFSRCRCVGNLIRCGNGVLDPGEQCDDGNTMDSDGCGATCQREWAAMVGGVETCGNGIVEEGEQCDDGNTRNGDGCSQSCRWEMSLAGATQSAGVGAEHGAGSQGIYTLENSSLAGGVTMPGGAQVTGGAQMPGGMQAQTGLQTIIFPGGQGWGAATQQGQGQQYYPSFYGSVTPYVTPSGPVGNTGPASVAVIAAGAAAGFAWARRKRKM